MTKAPAGDVADRVANAMRAKGVLVSTDGPHHNVLKLKPPLVISADDAEELLAALSEVLAAL